MFIWFDQVWTSYAEKKQKELDFTRSLMVYDAFKACTIDEMKAVLSINSTNLCRYYDESLGRRAEQWEA